MIANCGVIKYVVLALQVLVLRGEQLIQLFSENRYKCFISIVRQTSLIPRPSIPPVLIAYCIKKWREKAWRMLSHNPCHDLRRHHTSFQRRQVMYESDLAFCASYEDGTNTSRELQRAHET